MVEIPSAFNQPGAAFVLLPDGIKFPPIEKGWQEKGHSFQEAAAHKGNVGILAGNGFIGLDQISDIFFELRPCFISLCFLDDCVLGRPFLLISSVDRHVVGEQFQAGSTLQVKPLVSRYLKHG